MHTFTIVTTKANPLMAKIHNNPKLPEPSMHVILAEEDTESWLNERLTHEGREVIDALIKPYPEELLNAFTV